MKNKLIGLVSLFLIGVGIVTLIKNEQNKREEELARKGAGESDYERNNE